MELAKLNQKDIAWVFDVTTKTISRWTKAGLPRNRDRSYNIRDVVRWRAEQIENDMPDVSDADTEESKKWLAEFRKEKALAAKLDRQEREAELLPADQVVREADHAGRMTKAKLTALPARLAPLVAPESGVFECEQLLKTEINDILTDLVNALRAIK